MRVTGVPQLEARFRALGSGQANRQLMGQLGYLAVHEAQRLAPRRTGNLARSIRLGTVTPTSAVVQAGGLQNVGYAGFVEFGTRPHVIVPRNRKALRFAASAAGRRLTGSPRVGAAVVFAKRVMHPGTKAQPFLRQGAANALTKSGLADILVRAWNEAA